MKLDFYGLKSEPPTIETAKAFGSAEKPLLIEEGQRTTYRAGDIILKPSGDKLYSFWEAEVFEKLKPDEEVRCAKPIRGIDGSWVYQGFVAWSYLEGSHIDGRFTEKLAASKRFHQLLNGLAKPDFLATPRSSWSTADKAVWEQRVFDYDPGFMELIDQIKPHLEDLELPRQLVHGDLAGNFLFAENLPPAIIDFSPVWAPNGFAEGIMLADAIVWENAREEELEVFKSISNIDQFAWRGTLRRIVEQAEHIKWFGKDKDQALREAAEVQKAIDYLTDHF